MKALALATATVFGLLAAPPAFAQGALRAGKWEVTTQMEMPGMPMQLPATTRTQCVTQAQQDDPASTLPSGSPDPQADCKASDYRRDGDKVTWKLTCTGSQPMTGQGSIVVDGDRYDGTMVMTMDQGSMTMKYAGKRVGDCAP
jgi:hypothetical protein